MKKYILLLGLLVTSSTVYADVTPSFIIGSIENQTNYSINLAETHITIMPQSTCTGYGIHCNPLKIGENSCNIEEIFNIPEKGQDCLLGIFGTLGKNLKLQIFANNILKLPRENVHPYNVANNSKHKPTTTLYDGQVLETTTSVIINFDLVFSEDKQGNIDMDIIWRGQMSL
jgi:hypothetical protein